MGCQLCKEFFEPGEIRVANDVVGATGSEMIRPMRLEDVPPERLSMATRELEAIDHTLYLRKNRKFAREGSLDFDAAAKEQQQKQEDDSYVLLRNMVNEPVGRFYLHDYAVNKNLADEDARVLFISLVYRLANELEKEGRIAPCTSPPAETTSQQAQQGAGPATATPVLLPQETAKKNKTVSAVDLETDEDRYARLDEYAIGLLQCFAPGSNLERVSLASPSERERFLETRLVAHSSLFGLREGENANARNENRLALDSLSPASVLEKSSTDSAQEQERKRAMRTKVLSAVQRSSRAAFRFLCDSGFVSEFKLHSEYRRYLSKFATCYNNLDHWDFDFMSVLGKGSFGRVLRVRKQTTKREYAMKIMSKRKILSGAENAAQVTIERNVLVECNHPSVIKVNYAFHTTRALFLVLDLLEGGTLVTAMNNCGGVLPLDICAFFTAQIIQGLEHLHDHGILFRDLKPLNVLLDRKGNAVLTDMGLACKFRASKPGVLYNGRAFDGEEDATATAYARKTLSAEEAKQQLQRKNSIPILPKEKLKCVGTYGFRAPELMATETDRTQGYGPPVDYFALGVTVCYMLTAKMPFRQRTQALLEAREKPKDTERRLQRQPPRLHPDLPEHVQDLIKGLLHLDPAQRLGGDDNMDALKSHAFFAGMDWDRLERRELRSPYQVSVRKQQQGKDDLPQFSSVHAAMAQFAHENVLEMFGGENEMKDEYTHVPRAEQRHFRHWDFLPDSALEEDWALAEAQEKTKLHPRRRKMPIVAAAALQQQEEGEGGKKSRAATSHRAPPQPELEVVDG